MEGGTQQYDYQKQTVQCLEQLISKEIGKLRNATKAAAELRCKVAAISERDAVRSAHRAGGSRH